MIDEAELERLLAGGHGDRRLACGPVYDASSEAMWSWARRPRHTLIPFISSANVIGSPSGARQ